MIQGHLLLFVGGTQGAFGIVTDKPYAKAELTMEAPAFFKPDNVRFWRYAPLSTPTISFMLPDFRDTHQQN